ncbi:MAG: hypothetical protein ACOCVH_02090 [Verrucomicrobiota bacterium]
MRNIILIVIFGTILSTSQAEPEACIQIQLQNGQSLYASTIKMNSTSIDAHTSGGLVLPLPFKKIDAIQAVCTPECIREYESLKNSEKEARQRAEKAGEAYVQLHKATTKDVKNIQKTAYADSEDKEEEILKLHNKLYDKNKEILSLKKQIELLQQARETEALKAVSAIELLSKKLDKTEGLLAKYAHEGNAVRLQVLQASFQESNNAFIRENELHFVLRNKSNKAISKASFEVTLYRPGRTIPDKTGRFSFEFQGGMEPGERKSYTHTPNFFTSEWAHVQSMPNMRLSVKPVEVYDQNGNVF